MISFMIGMLAIMAAIRLLLSEFEGLATVIINDTFIAAALYLFYILINK